MTLQTGDPTKTIVVQGATGQTANIFEVDNSAGVSLFSVNAAGVCSASVPGPAGPAGSNGSPGISPSYLGSFSSAPGSPALLNWYYDTTLKQAMICTNATGPVWSIMAKDGAAGANGTGVSWQGSLSSAPSSPSLNWAYYDTTLLQSRIYSGGVWNVLCKDGAAGANGSGGCPSADTTIIYLFSGTYYACDGRSGTTLTSNASATVVIQYALNGLSSTGGTVHIGMGLFSGISSILQIPTNVKVVGAGNSTVIQLEKSAGTNQHVFMFTDVSNSSLTDLQVDGNYYTVGDQTNSQHGICVQGSTNIHVERIYVHNCYYDGIYVGWNTDCSTDVFVSDCRSFSNHRNGYASTGGTNVNFIRCKSSQSGNCGFDIETNNTTTTFTDNTMDQCESYNELGGFNGTGLGGTGFYVAAGYNNALNGNIKLLNCKAHGNTVGSGATGFDITNTASTGGNLNVIVEGGESYGNWSGLELHGTQQNIIIKGLRCMNNLHTGMYIYNDSTSYTKKNIIVDDCIVYSNGSKGIYVEGVSGGAIDGVLVKGCVAYSNGDVGIYVGASGAGYVTNSSVLGCRSYSNTTAQYSYGTGVTQANNL